jgi:hypothetical protein
MICFPELTLDDIRFIKDALRQTQDRYSQSASKFFHDPNLPNYYQKYYKPTYERFTHVGHKLSNHIVKDVEDK